MDQTMGWRKSSRCDSNSCVEVAPGPTRAAVRDSTDPGQWLTFAREDWRAFVRGLPERED